MIREALNPKPRNVPFFKGYQPNYWFKKPEEKKTWESWPVPKFYMREVTK